MAELSNAQHLVHNLRSLHTIQNRISTMSDHWGGIHMGYYIELNELSEKVGALIAEFEQCLIDEKLHAKEKRNGN